MRTVQSITNWLEKDK